MSFAISKDAVTDLTAGAEPVPGVVLSDALAHQGILRAANYVADYIHNNRILETAFDIVPVGDVQHSAY